MNRRPAREQTLPLIPPLPGRGRRCSPFDFAPDAYLVTDTMGTIREANRVAAGLLGVPDHFLIHKPLVAFIAPEHRRAFRSRLSQVQRAERVTELEVPLRARSGVCFDGALPVSIIPDAQGRPVELRWLIRDVSARFRAEEQVRTINLELESRVAEQASRLSRLVSELLDVSRLDSGNLVMHRSVVDVSIQYGRHDERTVRIAVTDRGRGVVLQDRDRIFARFFQASPAPHSPGLGLGLYVSRQIAEFHGGQLQAEFPSTGGSRFVVTLPMWSVESHPDQAKMTPDAARAVGERLYPRSA